MGRIGDPGQERYRFHDLTGLAVPALGDLFRNPSHLDGMIGRDTLNGGNGLPLDISQSKLAGTRRFSIHNDSACAADSLSTSILGAHQFEALSDHPEQVGVRFQVNLELFTVYGEFDHWPFSILIVCEIRCRETLAMTSESNADKKSI